MVKYTQDLSEADFPEKVAQVQGPVLIVFHANWCAPCREMYPFIETLASLVSEQMTVYKVDIGKNHGLASGLQVKGIPTFVVFKKGKECGRLVGAMRKLELLAFAQRFLDSIPNNP